MLFVVPHGVINDACKTVLRDFEATQCGVFDGVVLDDRRVLSLMWWKFTDGDLRRLEVRGLGGEVNELGWPLRQRLPAIDLAHRDLPGSK
jgi:hypothetical protein